MGCVASRGLRVAAAGAVGEGSSLGVSRPSGMGGPHFPAVEVSPFPTRPRGGIRRPSWTRGREDEWTSQRFRSRFGIRDWPPEEVVGKTCDVAVGACCEASRARRNAVGRQKGDAALCWHGALVEAADLKRWSDVLSCLALVSARG